MSEGPLKPNIVFSSYDKWAAWAADIIVQNIHSAISCRGICNVMLTGGNTAERLYRQWSESSILPLEHIRFFFGDERCVPPGHSDSNYALVMRTLLNKKKPAHGSVMRMEAERHDRDAAARDYEELLPEKIDVLLLGMGADGHVASLFPFASALQPAHRSVLPVIGPNPPRERLTITPRVIASAGSVYLLATGEEKGKILAEAMGSPGDYLSLPVRLTLGGTWLLDDDAAYQLMQN